MSITAAVFDPPTGTSTVATPVTVKQMERTDAARWDAFVMECPEATFFHRAGWKEVIEESFGHKTWFFYAEVDGRIQGVLPLAQVNSLLFGHSLCSLPFCVYGGIAANVEAARHALDQAAQELAAHLAVGHLEYRNQKPLHADWHSKPLYVTFRMHVLPNDEQNMRAIPSKRRNMIRKGIKHGLQSQIDDRIDRFFEAYSTSVHRLGTPVFPKRYFALLKSIFKEDCEILTITDKGHTLCSMLSFYFKDEMHGYYGGGKPEARDLAGNDFMYWKLLQRASEKGMRIFDFGRSKVGSGSYDFKKLWGLEPVPLHYEYQLHAATRTPENNPLNPKYQLFIKMWKKLPLPLANFLGPYIVRNLG